MSFRGWIGVPELRMYFPYFDSSGDSDLTIEEIESAAGGELMTYSPPQNAIGTMPQYIKPKEDELTYYNFLVNINTSPSTIFNGNVWNIDGEPFLAFSKNLYSGVIGNNGDIISFADPVQLTFIMKQSTGESWELLGRSRADYLRGRNFKVFAVYDGANKRIRLSAIRTDRDAIRFVLAESNRPYSGSTTTRERAVAASNAENPSPYLPGLPSSPAGGGGNFGNDRVSDDIRPYIPNGSAENDVSNCGLFTRYLVNNAQLRQFSEDVFSTGLIDVLIKEFVEITYGKVYDAIISLVSYPFAVASLSGVTTTAGNIYLGRHNTGAPSSGILTNGFGQIDWGTIEINEFWGNFLDYAPHTKIQLYLPWGTGFVDIDPNEVMNGTIQVLTNVELSKGNCVHMVLTGSGSVIGVYNGFCGSQYPITSVDTSGKVIATATAAVALATAGASGVARNMGALEEGMRQARELEGSGFGNFADAMREATQRQFIQRASYNALHSRPAKIGALSSVAAARISPTYPRNGSFSPSASSLSPQVPYIIMTWPDQSVPAQYGSHVGYPSNIFSNLGRLRGYTEVGAIHLDGINCTEHEREELMTILQGGVIL